MAKPAFRLFSGFFSGLVICLFLSACAIIGTGPVGGKKDTKPPKVLGEEPANKYVNFSGEKIIINFDEFIDLGTVSQEVIISPTLKKMPSIMVNRKSLVINFKNITLQPNTTYSIQFGKAIKDINEGNILRNYRYVFSTGPYLDSLFVSGRALDAQTHKPDIAYKVELYKAGNDSDIYKRKPLYYGKTDSSGRFKVDYLPRGDYQLYVLSDDKSENYFVDEGEQIGFPPATIHLDTNDIIKDSICTFPFVPVPVIYNRTLLANRMLQVKFNHAIDTVYLEENGRLFTPPFGMINDKRDSFTYWFADDLHNIKVTALNKDFKTDSVVVKDTEAKALRFVPKFAESIDNANSYGTPLIITSNKPIKSIDFGKAKIYEDSTVVKSLSYRFLDSSHTNVGILYNYQENKNYKFRLWPGSILSVYDEKNRDTVVNTFAGPGLKNFGYFEMDVNLGNGNYIFQLINESGAVVFYKIVPRETLVKIPFVNPGKYRIRLVKDDNSNGRWDAGDLKTRQQPEEIIYYPGIINMKANWEMVGMKFDLVQGAAKKR